MALTTLAGTSACVQDQDFLIVENAIWFDSRDNCVLTGSEPTPLVMVADVSFDTRIGMGFLLSNNQSPNPGSNTGIDDSEIAIKSAEVSLSFSGGSITGGNFQVTLPNDSIAGGSSGLALVQIPTAVTQSMRASMTPGQFETLEMTVIFNGRKYGQSGNSKLGEVSTRPYTYPFEVCLGCLSYCDAECATPCPTQIEFVGTCGFAQGAAVYHPGCAEPE